jgi:hypothetical protein
MSGDGDKKRMIFRRLFAIASDPSRGVWKAFLCCRHESDPLSRAVIALNIIDKPPYRLHEPKEEEHMSSPFHKHNRTKLSWVLAVFSLAREGNASPDREGRWGVKRKFHSGTSWCWGEICSADERKSQDQESLLWGNSDLGTDNWCATAQPSPKNWGRRKRALCVPGPLHPLPPPPPLRLKYERKINRLHQGTRRNNYKDLFDQNMRRRLRL